MCATRVTRVRRGALYTTYLAFSMAGSFQDVEVYSPGLGFFGVLLLQAPGRNNKIEGVLGCVAGNHEFCSSSAIVGPLKD